MSPESHQQCLFTQALKLLQYCSQECGAQAALHLRSVEDLLAPVLHPDQRICLTRPSLGRRRSTSKSTWIGFKCKDERSSFQSGRKGLPSAAGAIPDKKRSSAAARPRCAAQRRTDSFWAKDMMSRVKIINGKGAT